MAERMTKQRRSRLSRSASSESSELPVELNKPVKRKLKKPKERWLLTRKTWRYMADAGRKLIPEGAQNHPEDIPKIEAYFQEVCKREPRFLLWRKNSYPGALVFRKKRKDRRKGGSCRKASSADEVDDLKPERPKDLPLYPGISGGRFDIQKMKYDFLNAPPPTPSPRTFLRNKETYPSSLATSPEENEDEEEESVLINMLEKYLQISDAPTSRIEFDYSTLVDKLERHLTLANIPSQPSTSSFPPRREGVHFVGDHVQKSLSETLSRYFSHSSSRDKIVSDILTDRKALQRLYFELRQIRGFRGRRDYIAPKATFDWEHPGFFKSRLEMSDYKKSVPPPLIEIQGESIEPTYSDLGVQTPTISEADLAKIDEEYKKLQQEKEEEEREIKSGTRRRSSADNDDVSQSVSDTIKRYLRMARKKSSDSDKADRFKRVNYDRNLRNIKPKGEITKPGDDDGLNKGCQTNDDWILTYRELKFDECNPIFDIGDSRQSSTRSSFDAGVILEAPQAPSPTSKTHQSFLSSLLHGKHSHDKSSSAGLAMQKSKSSSSVVHHGSRLMAKSIFKRSKSQSRVAHQQQPCTWTPKGSSTWTNVAGKQVVLADTTLHQLSDIERKVLQKVALAKLQALNLGVTVKIPSENVGAVVAKKRRPYLLKRKALTTGIFDTGRKDLEKEKGSGTGLVFGIPLSQCVENDRVSRVNSAGGGVFNQAEDTRTIGRTSSRASFSSLIDATLRTEEKGSCESLARDRMLGSVPGLLDTISCGSNADITTSEESRAVPNIVNECIRHLEQNGLHTLGIFRVSSSKKRVRQLREEFDSGKETVLNNDQCPHDVATLLKEFLRDLPDPLLCRDLYYAFVQTQRIRNRRLQLEALQHLIQLLPSVNRDTLAALLNFLSIVAKNSNDQTDALGETLIGNKMNASNLATIFAPNILHSVKQGGKEQPEWSDDRIDVINVIRTMIDNNKSVFTVSSELLDEIYVHMMDSHPEALEELLNKKDGTTYESQDEISDGSLWSPPHTNTDVSLEESLQKSQDEVSFRQSTTMRKTYSREEFLHETAATGGPNVAMRFRHKERIRERSLKKRRDESAARSRREEDSGSSTSSLAATKLRDKDGMSTYTKTRSSSLESSSSLPVESSEPSHSYRIDDAPDRRKSTPYVLDNSGIITASLTIPVQTSSLNVDEYDIPYIEDGSSTCTFSIDGKHQMTVGVVKSPVAPPRRRQRSMSGSDSSIASVVQPVTGSISLIQQGYDSAIGSSVTFSSPPHNTPSSVGSSIADASGIGSPPSWASSPPTSPDSNTTTVNYIPDDINVPSTTRVATTKLSNVKQAVLQKVSFTTGSEIHRAGKPADIRRDTQFRRKSTDIQKCASTPAFSADAKATKEKVNTGITSIGNAVLRSKTADFERISTTETKTTTTTTTVSEKKKYTKRRYTDSRHQTRHIPDSETIDTQQRRESKSSTQTVYKRRELISSVPSESQ